MKLFKDIFKRKNKGCLHGKSEEEKVAFFKSLEKFRKQDPQFFEDQYCDLLIHERAEFEDWLSSQNKRFIVNPVFHAMSQLIIEQIIKNRHRP